MHYLERQHQLLELMQLIPLQLPSESELCVCVCVSVCVCVCVCKRKSEGKKIKGTRRSAADGNAARRVAWPTHTPCSVSCGAGYTET
jgi:hypothetical protein